MVGGGWGKGEERRGEHTAKGLGRLARQERGEVVDRDDREGRAGLQVVDGHGRLVEGGRHGVDGHGGEGGGCVLVMGVLLAGGVGEGLLGEWAYRGDVAHDRELAVGGLEGLEVDCCGSGC